METPKIICNNFFKFNNFNENFVKLVLFYICFHNLHFFYKLELVYLNENLDLDLLELIYFNGNFVKLVVFLKYIFLI